MALGEEKWPECEGNTTSNFELFLFLKDINLKDRNSGHSGLWAADVASCLLDMPGSTPSPLHLRETWAAAITTPGFLFLLAVTQICSCPCLSLTPLPLLSLMAVCLRCVSLTSSHLWRGCRGCSFRRRPAAGGRLRWHGDSPTLSGRCTGWLCRTWQTKDKGLFSNLLLFLGRRMTEQKVGDWILLLQRCCFYKRLRVMRFYWEHYWCKSNQI